MTGPSSAPPLRNPRGQEDAAGSSSVEGLNEGSFPSPKESATNTPVFGALKITSSLPASLGWVSLPEMEEAPPIAPMQ